MNDRPEGPAGMVAIALFWPNSGYQTV